ncbi:glycosyltransferase family 4 protein [Luteimonas sp. MC1782]|uniref:glycosyltransferase family 4 protein n=1 Tax=Luteimonas sp. MC1782 TaxID=2760305 RepID=UPI0016016EAD|nr:glycosyltransferase family 4 protein [Luteimonas sp. MC1782]MBB1472227.1 glycosyltransferase family 4 protein [Luteimonas sp. MC1782]
MSPRGAGAPTGRHLVILNQAANYLTVGFANAFNRRFGSVTLVTGSVHVQGEALDQEIKVHYINRWHERPARKKALSYGLALLRMWWLLLTKYRRHEVLFVSVPPMAYLLNLVLPHRFSMVIWDIYPDVLKISGMKESHPVYRIWSWLNRRSFQRAYRLFTISEVMADALGRYVDRNRLVVQPIWSMFQGGERVERADNRFLRDHHTDGRFVVQYSGNIGLTHNVELLIDVAERLKDDDRILFQIIGRGPRELAIRRKVAERGLSNVKMLPFQSDDMFPHSLSAADLGVVMLDERVSQGSVPSKAYNLMSFGVPSLYVATPDSELARYANGFGHAQCLSAGQLGKIAAFILELASRPELQEKMAGNARVASGHFTRANADCVVDAYLEKSDLKR